MEIIQVVRPCNDTAAYDKFIVALETKIKKEQESGVAHSFTHRFYFRHIKGIPWLEVVFAKLAPEEDMETCVRLYQATRFMEPVTGSSRIFIKRKPAFPIALPAKEGSMENRQDFVPWAYALSDDIAACDAPIPHVYAHQTGYVLSYGKDGNGRPLSQWRNELEAHLRNVVAYEEEITNEDTGEVTVKKHYRYKLRPTGRDDSFYVETPIELHIRAGS